MKVTSKKQFARLPAFSKGYAVYWLGMHKDEPHVPKSYDPSPRSRKAYERGAAAAARDAQDSEG